MEVSIITGAGSGIGAAVAKKLAARGSFAALADRDEHAVLRCLEEVKAAGGSGMAGLVDVTDEEQVAAFVDRVVREAGRPTSAVASAGIAATGSVTEMPTSLFRQMIDVNLTGTFLLARHVIHHLEQGGGSFTAIASDAGLNGFQAYAGYCASKHAVVGLVKAMALDHGPKGVRSNAICPGYVETPMLDNLMSELGASTNDAAKGVPLARLAKADDVANLADFLTSEAGSYLNGAIIAIDGGGSAGPYQPV